MRVVKTSASIRRRLLRLTPFAITAALILTAAASIIHDAISLVFGASAVAFLSEPLAVFFERRLSRGLAALAAIATILSVALAVLLLLMPTLIRETSNLLRKLPESVALISRWAEDVSAWLETHFTGVKLPAPDFGNAHIPALAEGTLNAAGSIAGLFTRASLMIVLGYFLLCDRARLLILLELLFPRAIRRTAVRLGNAVCRELRLYLRGQGLISLAVGALTSLGLYIIGLPSALALGMIVGIFNMIPYFGPVLGGIPAVLTALSCGWQTAALTIGALWLVQQIDGSFISPRIMSSVTGLSPAAVLLAIFIGSGIGGIVGMLIALPALMTFRTIFRVFVQTHENV